VSDIPLVLEIPLTEAYTLLIPADSRGFTRELKMSPGAITAEEAHAMQVAFEGLYRTKIKLMIQKTQTFECWLE